MIYLLMYSVRLASSSTACRASWSLVSTCSRLRAGQSRCSARRT